MSSIAASSPGLSLEGKPFTAHCLKLREEARKLPVARDLPRLLQIFKDNDVMILSSETGSGKTTQMPKAILEAGLLPQGKLMAVTQNRRLAAQECAQRVAAETGTALGGVIGARYRGVNKTRKGVTRLEVVTDGTLVATAKSDPDLWAYGVVIIDEAHQHTRPTDVLLGIVKAACANRPGDLKVIIMSATIDIEQFRGFFPGCAVATVQGSNHNVAIKYRPEPVDDMDPNLAELIMHVHLTGRTGDILVFASGTRQIWEVIGIVSLIMHGDGRDRGPRYQPGEIGPLDCYPLYSTLPSEYQDEAVYAVAPPPRNGKPGRKLIMATNIAETSITIVGVVHVIDTGKVKAAIWNPEDESWALREQNISKATAKQRSGRAGRTRDGVAYRMCTETGFHEAMPDFTVPEMQNGDMLQEVLDILRIGRNPLTFPYMSAPSTEVVIKALGILSAFGAIQVGLTGLEITETGLVISRLPVTVYHAVMLLTSQKYQCQDEILSLVAMLEATEGGQNLFVGIQDKKMQSSIEMRRKYFGQSSGDHIMLLNIYLAYREACRFQQRETFISENYLQGSVLKTADVTRQQLLGQLCHEAMNKQIKWSPESRPFDDPHFYTPVLKVLAYSHMLRVAKRLKPVKELKKHEPILWETVRHGALAKMPTTGCHPPDDCEWVVYDEYSNQGPSKRKLRIVTPIPLDLLISAQPAPWVRMNLAAGGKVQDAIVKTIASMGNLTEAYVRQTMPPPANANQPAQ